ncbi:MAG: PIG-L deacetylase family protein [Ilumatobacteraceae bacterium]
MLGFTLGADLTRPLSILCLGAHSDDIEIGCGGTLLRLLAERPGTSVHWVVFSADDAREVEARASAAAFLTEAGSSEVIVHRFRESYFPFVGAEIKDAFEAVQRVVTPDVVFTHRRDDEHQDHRTVAELTWNTFRDHVIAEYEIPKYEGDLGQPNLFVPLGGTVADRKVELLMEHFGSQRSKRWFRPETFRGLMALRAVECNAPDGWAEAFHARKLTL